MTGPLAKYYPLWVQNCLDSIIYIQSGDRNKDRIKFNQPSYSPEQDLIDIADYQEKAIRYQARIDGKEIIS